MKLSLQKPVSGRRSLKRVSLLNLYLFFFCLIDRKTSESNSCQNLRYRRFPVNFLKFLRTLFCRTFTNGCFLHLGISLLREIFSKSHIEEMCSFLHHFGTRSFQIDFRILYNLRVLFKTLLNIYDRVFL